METFFIKIGARKFICSDFDENVIAYVPDDSNKKKIAEKKIGKKMFKKIVSYEFFFANWKIVFVYASEYYACFGTKKCSEGRGGGEGKRVCMSFYRTGPKYVHRKIIKKIF